MSKKTWVFGTYGVLLTLQLMLLAWTLLMISDPLFSLIPVNQSDPWILLFIFFNLIQAILCGIVIFALHKTLIPVVFFCHFLVCGTILIDCLFVFVFASKMSDVHTSIGDHIATLYTEKNDNCAIWSDVYHRLECCPPAYVLQSCGEMLNISRSFCAHDHLMDCNAHLRKWLLTKTEIVGLFAFCSIAPLKGFSFCALGKDIEKVKLELEEQFYFEEMVAEVERHGDGYIDSFKSQSNLVLNTVTESKVRSVSQYSPYVRPSVIEEVEYEFTVRGDELREQLQHAMAAHSQNSTDL